MARNPKQLCFCCGRNGHYAKDCCQKRRSRMGPEQWAINWKSPVTPSTFSLKESVHNGYLEFENVEFSCPIVVKGRLRENISFWQNIGASRWVLRVLQEGYSLPFISLPQEAFFRMMGQVLTGTKARQSGCQLKLGVVEWLRHQRREESVGPSTMW